MQKNFGLIGKLVLAMAIGALTGAFAPDCVIRSMNCFSGTFGQFIKFVVPFIIVGLVTPAIAETGRSAGRLLLLTMGIAYASTLFAGAFALTVSSTVFPAIMGGHLDALASAKNFPAYFVIKIPPVMDVTTALVTAFIFGLGMEAVQAHMNAEWCPHARTRHGRSASIRRCRRAPRSSAVRKVSS